MNTITEQRKADSRAYARAIEEATSKALYTLDPDNDNDWCTRMVHAFTGTEIHVCTRPYERKPRIVISIAYVKATFLSDQGGNDHRTYSTSCLYGDDKPSEATEITMAADRPIAQIAKRALKFTEAMAPTWAKILARRDGDIAFHAKRDALRVQVGEVIGKHNARGHWYLDGYLSVTVTGGSIKVDGNVSLDELRALIAMRAPAQEDAA